MSYARVLVALAVLAGCAAETPLSAPDIDPDLAGGPKQGTTGIAIVELPFLQAFDIDNAGRVIGWAGTCCSGPFRSVMWDPGSGQATDLGGLGGETFALAINGSLQVAGSSEDAVGSRPAVWDGGSWHPLPELGGPIGAAAEDVSDTPGTGGAHWVVGEVSGWSVPTIWSVSGTSAGFTMSSPTALPVPAGGTGRAFGVNSSGAVAGTALLADAGLPAAWATADGIAWQHTALQIPAGESGGQAVDINATGMIVGDTYRIGRACSYPLLWATAASSPTRLPDLAGGTCGRAGAINDAGYITGEAQDVRRRSHVVLWIPNGTAPSGYVVKALGRLKGANGSSAHSLNEPRSVQGTTTVEVVGLSSSTSGAQRATLWRVTVP
jgi:hypothetical protein